MDRSGDELVVTLLSVFLVLFVAYLIIKYGVKSGMKAASDGISGPKPPAEQANPAPPNAAFPVIPISGKFKVSGVDHATRMDTTGYYAADSQENARVKAELDGIVVTSVEWVGEQQEGRPA